MNLPTAWKFITRLACALGVLLTVLLGFELLRIFVFLYRFRPSYGWTFAILMISGMVGMGIYLIMLWRQCPSRQRPPPQIDLDRATHPQLKRYARHMISELRHQTMNAWIPDSTLSWLEEEMDTLEGLLNHHPLNEDLIRIITKSDQEIESVLQDTLWQEVDAIIQSCAQRIMRDASCGTQRPIHYARLLITQIGLINRIVSIADPAPTLRHRARIILDVSTALLSPSVEHAEQSLIRKLQEHDHHSAAQNDRIGTIAGTGLITIMGGEIAFQRCLFPHRWDATDAETVIRDCLPDGLARIQKLLNNDLHPQATTPSSTEAAKPKPSLDIKGICNTVAREPRSTQPHSTQSARRPPNTIAPRSVNVPERMDHETTSSSHSRKRRKRRTKRRRGIARILHTFGQRIKYTMGLGRR